MTMAHSATAAPVVQGGKPTAGGRFHRISHQEAPVQIPHAARNAAGPATCAAIGIQSATAVMPYPITAPAIHPAGWSFPNNANPMGQPGRVAAAYTTRYASPTIPPMIAATIRVAATAAIAAARPIVIWARLAFLRTRTAALLEGCRRRRARERARTGRTPDHARHQLAQRARRKRPDSCPGRSR